MSVARDLERRPRDAWLHTTARLADWARTAVEPRERDLGALADWAADVTTTDQEPRA